MTTWTLVIVLIGYQYYGGYSNSIVIENFKSREECYEGGSKIINNLPMTNGKSDLNKSYTCISKGE